MSFSITDLSSKENDAFIHEMWMEASNLASVNRGLTLKSYQRFFSNLNESKVDNFFKKTIKIMIEFSRPKLTKESFNNIVADVNKIMGFYPNSEINLSNNDIAKINEIADKTLFDLIVNSAKYDFPSIKEMLYENNIKNEQINNALLWMCLRFSYFYQSYGLKSIEESCYE